MNQSAVNVSGMLGAAIMPALALAYGWQAGFVLAAALAFVVCGVAVAFYRDPRPGSRAAAIGRRCRPGERPSRDRAGPAAA